ncbi:MAG: TRAP transporter substrate-binding protein [Spirochaetales bacterium]
MRVLRLFVIASILAVLSAAVFAAGQSEEGTEVQEESVVLRLSEVNPDGDPVTDALRFFAERAGELSDGRIDVRVFPSSQLGGQADALQGLKTGSIDLTRTNPANLTDFGVEKIGVFSLPYIFQDSEHAWRVIQSDVGDEVLQAITDSGARFVGLEFFLASPRNFFFTEAEVTSLADMEGLKLRVQPAEIYIDLVEAMGASPTPIAFSELYSALQTGVVDGAEQPIKGYFSNNLFEVAPFYTFTRHLLEPSPLLISELTWNNLSEQDRAILRQAAGEASELYRDGLAEAEAEFRNQLEEQGVTFLEVDSPQEWVDAVSDLYGTYAEGSEDLVDRIQSLRN